jgi:membrane protein implicated in regulation of membrane protease activity
MLLRFMGLVAPPGHAGVLARVRGIAIILALIVALVLVGTGVAQLVALPFGGLSLLTSVWIGILILIVALVVLAVLGRRRQGRAKAARGAGPGK